MSQSDISLPEFIHIGKGSKVQNTNAKASLSPTGNRTPSKKLCKTPTRILGRPLPGILKNPLKNPSYKFTGIRSTPKVNKVKQPALSSTPTTVGTNESLDDNDSISRSSSCGSSTIGSVGTFVSTSTEGIQNAIDKIINEKEGSSDKKKGASDKLSEENVNHDLSLPSSSASVASTSSTSMCTSGSMASSETSSTKEELQRIARIKRIEDLNEQISNAKARKLVERKAYRREDKLLLRLARQLKTVTKRSRENTINIEILEESNKFCEDFYDRFLEELKELRSSRSSMKMRLFEEKERKLTIDREKRERILRVQNAELEAHKRSHQYHCQVLCESVLEANKDLERMRTLWEEHIGDGSALPGQKGKRQKKMHRMSLWVVMAVVMVITAIVIQVATAEGKNRKKMGIIVEKPQQQEEQHRLLPPHSIMRSGILHDENIPIGDLYLYRTPLLPENVAITTRSDSKNYSMVAIPSTNSCNDGDDVMKNNLDGDVGQNE